MQEIFIYAGKACRMMDISAAEIAHWLAGGDTVILPTETVYGLGVIPGNPDALKKVYALKGRPSEMNLPVVIGALEQLEPLGVDFNATAQRLAEQFWPGPLTLILGFDPAKQRASWLGGREEVAIRFPDLQLLQEVTRICGPIFLTSANAHGVPTSRVAQEAAASLLGTVDHVVDGGTLHATPSTIINTRASPAKIERLGAVSLGQLAEFIDDGSIYHP
jgi:L-threonylcarbamoyladenylate synthase